MDSHMCGSDPALLKATWGRELGSENGKFGIKSGAKVGQEGG